MANKQWRKNWEGQFHSQSVDKTKYQLEVERLGLGDEEAQRESTILRNWVRRWFETRYCPEFMLSTLRIVPSDEGEHHGFSSGLPRFSVRDAWEAMPRYEV